MNLNRAFGLVDSMIAMTIVLMAVGAILKMTMQNRKALALHTEREIAHEILANAQSLPTSYLEGLSERHFDFRGMPSARPDRYRLRVETELEEDSVCYRATLTYMDGIGSLRFLKFQRREWRQHEGL